MTALEKELLERIADSPDDFMFTAKYLREPIKALLAESVIKDNLTTEDQEKKTIRDQIAKNLEELGTMPSPLIQTGKQRSWENKSAAIYEHENGEAITLVWKIANRTTARVTLSREAAYHTMALISNLVLAALFGAAVVSIIWLWSER